MAKKQFSKRTLLPKKKNKNYQEKCYQLRH